MQPQTQWKHSSGCTDPRPRCVFLRAAASFFPNCSLWGDMWRFYSKTSEHFRKILRLSWLLFIITDMAGLIVRHPRDEVKPCAGCVSLSWGLSDRKYQQERQSVRADLNVGLLSSCASCRQPSVTMGTTNVTQKEFFQSLHDREKHDVDTNKIWRQLSVWPDLLF